MRKQYYMHNFLTSQPDLNFHNPKVQDAVLETVRFWLERGVDGFRLDTVNFYFHDEELRDKPPLIPVPDATGLDAPDVTPTACRTPLRQDAAENIGFLQRFRALLDEYGERTSVGEVGDGARSLKTVAAYTSGGDKCTCATPSTCWGGFHRQPHPQCVTAFQAAVTDGWVCWPSPTMT